MGAFLDKPKTDKNNDQGVAHVSLMIFFLLKFKNISTFFCSTDIKFFKLFNSSYEYRNTKGKTLKSKFIELFE